MNRIIWTAPFLLLALGAPVAAEPPAPAGHNPPAVVRPAPVTAQPAVVAAPAAKPPVPVTPEELVAQGETMLQRGSSIGQAVRKLLEDARKEADIIKITCLDDKLTQIDVNLRTVESRLDALKKAVDPDRRTHEFTVLTVLGQKMQVLDQEAHQCVGQAMFETGATKVVTQIDTNMLPYEEDASNPPVILPPSLPTVPPPASGKE